MASLNVKIHFSFYLVLAIYILVGNFTVFLIYTISAVMHEIAHSIVAQKRGYRLGEILLMPYGAVVSGASEEMSVKDDIAISLAGPIFNLFLSLSLMAFWWVFPITYSFTCEVVVCNLSLCLINLLPCYSLDGGRVAIALLRCVIKDDKAVLIVKILAVCFSMIFAFLFILSCFKAVNISYAIFSIIIICCVFSEKNCYRYFKITNFLTEPFFKNGVRVNEFAIDCTASLQELIKNLKTTQLNVARVYCEGKYLRRIEQEELVCLCNENHMKDSILQAINH